MAVEGPVSSPARETDVPVSDFEALREEAVALHGEHSTPEAFRVICRMVELYGKERVLSNEDLEDIVQRFEAFKTVVMTIEGGQQDGWITHIDKGEEMRISYRHQEGSPMYTFRLEGLIDAPLVDMLSVFNEIDLFPLWIPYFTLPFRAGLRESKTCAQLGLIEQVAHFHLDAPWPIANRDVVLHVIACDELGDKKRILVKMRSRRSDGGEEVGPLSASVRQKGKEGKETKDREGQTPEEEGWACAPFSDAQEEGEEGDGEVPSPSTCAPSGPSRPNLPLEETVLPPPDGEASSPSCSSSPSSSSFKSSTSQTPSDLSTQRDFWEKTAEEVHKSIPEPESGAVRMDVDGGIAIYPRSATRSFVQMAWTVDPKLSLPSWLLNFATKQIMALAMSQLNKVCKEAGKEESKHAERRRMNPELYSFVEEKIRQHGLLVEEGGTADAAGEVGETGEEIRGG